MPETNSKLSFDQFFLLLVGLIFFASIAFMAYSIFTRSVEGYSVAYLSQNPQMDVQLNQAYIAEFFIENHEGKKTDYFYEIYFDDQKLIDKIVSIDNNQTLAVTEYFQSLESFTGKKKLLIKVSPFDQQKNVFSKDAFELWVWVQQIE